MKLMCVSVGVCVCKTHTELLFSLCRHPHTCVLKELRKRSVSLFYITH